MNEIRIKLLASTPDPITVVYQACRTCYSAVGPLEMDAKDQDKMISLIERIIGAGHHSVLEHISFSFAIDGVSRTLTHQLVRHRIASFSQQSQRYVEFSGEPGSKKSTDFITPPTIKENEQAFKIYQTQIDSLYQSYLELTKLGIPAEDARFILPNATETKLIMTMNFRELITVSKLRLCEKAQWEIKQLFKLIKAEVNSIDSFLGNQLNPKCFAIKRCTELTTCGKYNW